MGVWSNKLKLFLIRFKTENKMNQLDKNKIGVNCGYINQEYQRLSWDQYFYNIVDVVRKRSHDSETQHGCVIVRTDNTIVTTGFNGFPSGSNDKELPNIRMDGFKYFFFNHAEESALITAAKYGISVNGCRIYISGRPCYSCARKLIMAGIKEWIVGDIGHKYTDQEELVYNYLVEYHQVLVRKFHLSMHTCV
jgi:dCMP deaminase